MKFLKVFAANIGVIAIIVIILFTGVALVLKNTTRHGESLTVPDITGLPIEKAEQLLAEKKLRYLVTDSLFFDDKPKSSVLEQNPEPQSKVKEGRIIYITLNSNTAPMVTMPNLVDVSLRQAQVMLQGAGLKPGQLIYRPDIAQNVVLDQIYGGRSMRSGSKLPKGSSVDLVLGNGLGDGEEVSMPDLAGLTKEEAGNLLSSSSLNIGSIVFVGPISDSTSARVFRQNPPYVEGGNVMSGQPVDIYLRQE